MVDAVKFWARVHKTKDCWIWLGALANGYGQVRFDGVSIPAHRAAYELLVGPIPDGFQIDHLCRVTNCVNPEHLEAVTPAENKRRGTSPAAVNARKTECQKGHPFDEVNTYVTSSGGRQCRTCKRDAMRRIRAAA